jgi:predicted Zn-dependent protease
MNISIKNVLKGVGLGIGLMVSLHVVGKAIDYAIQPPTIQTGAQYQRLNAIYLEIVKAAGISYRPTFNVVESPVLNAWTDGASVNITTGMLKFLENDDEIALVLGHELAHVYMFHVQDGLPDYTQVYKEANADKLGAFYMMKAGYDICIARELWVRTIDIMLDDPAVGSHPDSNYRYRQLNVNCEG